MAKNGKRISEAELVRRKAQSQESRASAIEQPKRLEPHDGTRPRNIWGIHPVALALTMLLFLFQIGLPAMNVQPNFIFAAFVWGMVAVLLFYMAVASTFTCPKAGKVLIGLAACLVLGVFVKGPLGRQWESEHKVGTTQAAPSTAPQRASPPNLAKPAQPIPSPRKTFRAPIFHEKKTDLVTVNFGGNTGVFSRKMLGQKRVRPFTVNGVSPEFYIDKDRPYVDTTVTNGELPATLIHGEFEVKPPDWDRNFNDVAFEVVDKFKRPVFQVIYANPNKMVIYGIFPDAAGGLLLLGESGTRELPSVPSDFHLEKIFKYPSWRFPGQYAEDGK